MSYSEGLTGAPPITEVPLELLEEVLWLFRVEDGNPNHCSSLLVPPHREPTFNSVLSPPRNQKKLPPEKQTPEVLYLAEGGNKDENNLTILTETLLSEKPTLAQGEMEAKYRDVPLVHLPDPQESEN
uniref:SLC51 subunit beta n=1 Tax=Capra hircus TaxID=9925 RepID=A0A452G6U4_CAPHI